MLYNRINKEIDIHPLPLYKCKLKCAEWLKLKSYEETENLLKGQLTQSKIVCPQPISMGDYHCPRGREKASTLKVWSAAVVEAVTRCGQDFCAGTSIHGFSHIAAPRRHWMERLLWVCVTGLAVWGAVDLSMGQLHRYNENPTVVTLEKDFRSWRFSLPAVTACYANRLDPSKLPSAVLRYWNATPSDGKYAYYAKFVDTVANSDVFHLDRFHEFRDDEQLDVDMYQLAVGVMYQLGSDNNLKTMTSAVSTTAWTTVMTEAGICYVTNSLASADVAVIKFNPNATRLFPVTCTYSKNCYIKIDVLTPFIFYTHSPNDVPDTAHAAYRIDLTEHRTAELSVMETGSGRGVRDIRPERRGCLYTDEPNRAGRLVYSTNTCRLSCRSRLARQLCGCVPFYYFYEEGPRCTAAGMSCLADKGHQLASNDGVKCPCAPQCEDSVYRETSTSVQIMGREPFASSGSLKLVVQPPRTRYTREIVFHFQDLVVSFGGAAGLFLGASFISFVEILYFILERVFKCVSRDTHSSMMKANVEAVTTHEMARIHQYTAILNKMKRYEEFDAKLRSQ